jgi:hypothetical protein
MFAGGRPVILCLVGVACQGAGVVWVFRPGSAEVNLIGGGLLYLIGTVPLMYVVERTAERKGRRGAWALISLLGPIALLVLRLLRPLEAERETLRRPRRARRGTGDRLAGVGLTILATAGFVWAGVQWFNRNDWPPATPVSQVPRNERRAFERVRKIIDAQQRYREVDWDGDGEKGYARFLVHLWRSVDGKGRPVEVNLIPRRLAFAMEEAFALDGYLYRDLYERELAQEDQHSDGNAALLRRSRPLSEAMEWSIAALPTSPGETGRLTFITDNSGKIWAKETGDLSLSVFPYDPAEQGWIEILSDDELRELQSTLD